MTTRGRPRQPLALAVSNGRVKVNPGRFKDRKEPRSDKLGNPPDYFTLSEIAIWCEICAIGWWFKERDRYLVEMVCTIMAAWRNRDNVSDARMNAASRMLGQLGMSATTASRVLDAGNDDETEDEF